MRLLHFADLHLGVESYGYPDPATGLNTRLLDFLKALDGVVDFALNNEVDLVLFCGDAYKRGHSVDPTEQREFARRILRLAAAQIPVFIVVGNHDLPKASGKASTVEIFPTLEVRNVYVARQPAVYTVPTRRGPLQVLALPWLSWGSLLSKDGGLNLAPEQMENQFRERVGAVLTKLRDELQPGVPAVLAAHLWVQEARVGSERELFLGTDPVLPLSYLRHPAFSYIALGHIHRHQVLSLAPPVVYSGSLERLDFSDEGVEKGFYVVDINEGGESRLNFHPLPARPFLTISLSLDSTPDDPLSWLRPELEHRRKEIAGAVVRLQITLPAEVGKLPERELQRLLKEDFVAYYALPPVIRRQSSPRTSRWDESAGRLTPLEALRRYLAEKKTPPEELKTLLDYGARLWQMEEETEMPPRTQ